MERLGDKYIYDGKFDGNIIIVDELAVVRLLLFKSLERIKCLVKKF